MPAAITVRAAAIIRDRGSVLLQRRLPESVWALPGGRVELGETAKAAVIREMREELAEAVEVERLVYVVENTFLHGRQRHQELGLYFLVSLFAGTTLRSRSTPFAGAEPTAALEFCWFDYQRLSGIDLRPSFLASALAAPELEFEHVIATPSGTDA